MTNINTTAKSSIFEKGILNTIHKMIICVSHFDIIQVLSSLYHI